MDREVDGEQGTNNGHPSQHSRIPLRRTTKTERLTEELRRTSLEDIMRTVRVVQVDMDSREAAEMEKKVESTYNAYLAVLNPEQRVVDIHRETGINAWTIGKWKRERVFPKDLERFMQSYFPERHEQRGAFAYLLGTMAHNNRRKEGEGIFTKAPRDERAKERLTQAIEEINPAMHISWEEKRRRIIVSNLLFRATLQYALNQEQEEFVSSKPEHEAYLQGFFDVSILTLGHNGQEKDPQYKIHMLNREYHRYLLRSFLSLGMYPSVEFSPNRQTIRALVLNGPHNLRQMIKRGFYSSDEDKKTVQQFLTEAKNRPRASVETYYALRQEVQEAYAEGETPKWTRLGEKYEFKYTTLQKWCGDLMEEHEQRTFVLRTPRVVRNYERALEELGMTNPFEHKQRESEELDLPNPFKHKQKESDDMYEDHRLIIDGQPWILTAKAQKAYFRAYGVEKEPLNGAHRAHIRGNLGLHLHGAESEMKFTLKGK